MRLRSNASRNQNNHALTVGDTPVKMNLLGNERPQKHYGVRFHYNLRTHSSKIDESFVDYFLDSERGNFSLFFDQALYEAPQIIRKLEEDLERQEEEAKAKKAGKNK